MAIDLEVYVNSAIATLRAGLPAKLAAINAEKGDFEIPQPPDDGGEIGRAQCCYSTGTVEILAYPFVEVALPDFTISDLSLGQVEGGLSPVVVVRLLHQDANVVRLDLSLKRYGRALLELLLAPDAFGASETVSSVRGGWRTNPERDERTVLTGAALAVFTLDSIAVR